MLDPGEFFTSLGSIASAEGVSVANIDSPTELNAVAGSVVGERRIAYQVNAGDNAYTIYLFDTASSAGANSPFVLAASGSGFWIAVNGKYTNGSSDRPRGVATIAALKALAGLNLGSDVLVECYSTQGDGGGGIFRWNSSDVTADNAGTIIAPNAGGSGRWNRISGCQSLLDCRWFGAKGDGTTDDTTAIQAAASLGTGNTLLFPPGTYKTTAAIALLDRTEVSLRGGATIQTATTTISILKATSKTGIRITGGRLKYTAGGSTQFIGGIELQSCSHCIIEDCEFEGMQWGGVYLFSSTYCTISRCYMHDSNASAQDCGDVVMRGDSSYNIVESNRLLGGVASDHGVLIQDHDGTHTTGLQHNIVSGNRIGAHKAYGVACYMLSGGNQFTIVDRNDIKDIDGSQVAGASGMGIYIQTAGGCTVTNNQVSNCNISTSTNVNLAAAISVSFDASLGASLRPCIVANNYVDTAHWVAIACSANHGCRIVGNTVRCTDDTNGKGIFVQNADRVAVIGNSVEINSTGKQGIYVLTNNGNRVGLVIATNVVNGSNDGLIYINQSGGYTLTAAITGNECIGGGSNAEALIVSHGLDCTISGNYLSGTLAALAIDGCTGCRGTTNICRSSNFTFLSSGTCSNNTFDQTNDFNASAAPARMDNAVAGNALESRATSAPASGTWAVGDRIEQATPAVGSPKGWRCTVAGSPGTWVSEGNL